MPRVLVVENSPKQAQELKSVLERAGIEVDTAPDAEQGLQRLADGPYDLVLSALFLRGATGFDLCREIKSDPTRRSIPVILTSRWASPNSVLRGLEVGADGFISKGLEPVEVVARVRRALARGAWPAPAAGVCGTRVVYREQEFQLTAAPEQLTEVLLAAFEDVARLEQQHREAIDELRRTEQTLREGEERYRSLAAATSQIIWTANAVGEVVGDLPTWRAFTGQTEAEIRGHGWLDAVHPDDRERTVQVWSHAVAMKCLLEIECRIRRYEGAYRHFWVRGVPVIEGDGRSSHFWQGPDFSLHGVPLVTEGGRIREWVGTCTDITERTQAERAVRDAEALYHSLVESLPLNVFRKDLDSKFTFANQLFCNSLGKPLEEIVGKTDLDFYPREFAEKYRRDDEHVIATRTLLEDVEQHHRPSGEDLYVQVLKTPVYDAQGNVVGTQCMFWDVTGRRRAEQQLERTAAELVRSNRELEQFAYIASHDLQEPLRMVSDYTKLLARRYQDKLDADAKEFIAFAVDGANRMQKMIKDLLALSRVATLGKPFKPTDCTVVFDAAVANLKRIIDETRAGVSYETLPTVRADETQLVQLFQNLISNAIKFRGQEPPRVQVAAERRESDWLFSVRDNGIGISPDDFDRIFAMFERLQSSQDFPGTGMGLAICKKIVERHGGRIWVESQAGQGATFYFTLPV